MAAIFKLNKGTDFRCNFPWPDGAGGALNLTGYTVAIVEASAALVGLTATAPAPAIGVVVLAMDYPAGLPKGRTTSFRVRITAPDGTDTTTNELFFEVE